MQSELEPHVLQSGGTRLSELVTWKLNDFNGGFSSLISDQERWSAEELEPNSIFADQLYAAVVASALCSHDQSDLRFCRLLKNYPYILLWLLASPPAYPCDHRKRVAREIVEVPWRLLDVSTAKLRIVWGDALRLVAITGVLPNDLF